MKALIVEPSKTFRYVLSRKLAQLGVDVDAVHTGAGGLQVFDGGRYDSLCLASLLPDMNGVEFCAALARRRGRPLPIIMLTAPEDQALHMPGMESGVTDVFYKSDLASFDAFLEDFVFKLRRNRSLDGRVLFVEDSRTTAVVVGGFLRKMGLAVDHFVSGGPALEQFHRERYDLVVTDVILEGSVTGIGLTRAIRASRGRRSQVPIIAISSLDDVARRVELLRSGVNDYLAKPVVEEELVVRIGNLLDHERLLDRVLQQQARLEAQATTDQLTGLMNRRGLTDHFPRLAARARRHGTPVSFIILDLDHFKVVNDTYGHAAGDAVLVAVAQELRRISREGDLIVRYGGEEFVLVMPECRGPDATHRAEVIRECLAVLNPDDIEVTASLGVTELPLGTPCGFDDVFKCADVALYRAKSRGRDRVEFRAAPVAAASEATSLA